jgi:hypothetical protein
MTDCLRLGPQLLHLIALNQYMTTIPDRKPHSARSRVAARSRAILTHTGHSRDAVIEYEILLHIHNNHSVDA